MVGSPEAVGRQAERLLAYVPRLALDWVANSPEEQHRLVEGTLVFVDVSGFTALTERLAVRGRAGTEEINEIVGSTFGELSAIGGRYGADLLKWGGDAALLLFDGPGSAARGARAGWLMARAMDRLGRLRTSAGRVELKVSVGVHSGAVELFLLGHSHRELVIAGPAATLTVEMEALASADEVVVSAEAAAALDVEVLGEARGHGLLLRGEPHAEERPWPATLTGGGAEVTSLIPERTRQYLLSEEDQVEHRPVTIGFVQLSGVDALITEQGATAVTQHLGPLVTAAQEAAQRHEVSFYGTDVAAGGVKIMLLGGVPRLEGNDADRLVRSTLDIVRPGASPPDESGVAGNQGRRSRAGTLLALRAGVNAGNVCVFSSLHLGRRRVYSITGDAVNLAARVVQAASPGQVRCTDLTRKALRSPFALRALPAFAAKGKSEPVLTYAVGEVGASPVRLAQKQHAFVGRRAELGQLLAAIADVGSSGRGRVVELVGPAGIGKSRLVDEALLAWPLPSFRVPCDAFDGGRPYRALRAVARRLIGLDDNAASAVVTEALVAALEKQAPALLQWAALLADVFDVSLPQSHEVGDLEPRFRRQRLEAAFVELAETLIAGPAAFVFEDAYALDEASASLVRRVAEHTKTCPWLVITTFRPGTTGWDYVTDRAVIELGALDHASSEELMAELALERWRPQERQALVERAAGNPLFLVELVRAAHTSTSAETLPDSLEPLLATRVDTLSSSDRRALRTAAVLGLRFDQTLLARVVEEDVPLDEALWGRLSEFVRAEDGQLVFTHALLRDAAYEGLSFRRRRELHARAAVAIEESAKGNDLPVELLSQHWLAAERWERAWECARLAGERAAALYANADASTQFRRALDAASHLRHLPGTLVARVGELLGDACELAGTYEQAYTAYRKANRRLPAGADRTRVLRKVGVLQERQGRYAQALRSYTSAMHKLVGDDAAAFVERCELKLASAGVLHRQGRLRESASEAALAGQDAARATYRPGLAHALYLRHINSVYLDEPDDPLAEEALAIYVELGDLVGQGSVLNNLGISAHYRGAWQEALEHYTASRAARERTGDLVGTAREENNIGEILSDQGHFAEAERCFNAAKSSWHAAEYPIGEALATSNLGRLAARTRRTLKGASLLEEARASFEAIHAVSYVDETDLRLAECTLLAGELQQAAAASAKLASRLAGRRDSERLRASALRLHGVALTELGEHAQAKSLLDESVNRSRAIAEGFELAQALAARAALNRRLGGRKARQAASDEAEAEALFARLGVTSTPTW